MLQIVVKTKINEIWRECIYPSGKDTEPMKKISEWLKKKDIWCNELYVPACICRIPWLSIY